jgi:antitoxin component of MazEF toxin-antitoxin module
MKIQVEKCKDKLFVVIPNDAISQLGWEHGDILGGEIADGGLKIVRTMTAHDHAMEIAHAVMDKYRETFEALAKS